MKKYPFLVAFGFLFGGFGTLHAQRSYSLEECTNLALQQSLQLQADALDLEKTNASVQQAYSALLPNLNASGSYQYSPQVQTSVIPSETFGGPSGTYIPARLGVSQVKTATVSLTQNIYNASAVIGLKAAKVLVAGNQLQVRSSQEDLVYNVGATYYNIQSLDKQEELTLQRLENTEALLATTTQQLQAGLATQTDVDRLTVTRDNTKANLENLQNSKEKYYNLLKVLMNMPLEETVRVVPFQEDEVGAMPENGFDALEKTNYLQLLQNKKLMTLEYQNIKAGYKPIVSLYANYGYSGFQSDANPFKNINGKFYPASSIGLKFSVPIFDGFNIKYQAKQKQIELQKIDVQAKQILQNNEQEVANAHADLRSNLITYQSQKRNLALAQKVMADINQQYQSGIVRVSDVINTTAELQNAQTNFVTALINFKQAEMSLKKAQGTLLP
ncbi:outer membrane protein TolC [Dyadobacter jejuensis]|uniref:Outer membrane protein TolC n=1 Tax=Dyadobacter jejuensis TaxID=1082580 RepID=A0A316ANX2_9BACT|nr:TolC family protein [Dyadobacter jejuensis]PWJ59475.1 outer membrane protein TolC [Dyadobacter jejuensis]